MLETDPDVILGGWNDWRESPGVEYIRTGFALSVDGGGSWSDFLVRPPVGSQQDAEGDPMTAADPRTGHMWAGGISFDVASNGGLYVARKNAGDNFFQPSVIASSVGGIDKAWMVAGRDHLTSDSTRLYITYNFGSVHSTDLGDNWSTPVFLGPGFGFLPRIGPDGELYVSYWSDGNDAFQIKRSFDGGGFFDTRVVAQQMDTWGLEEFNSRFPGTFRAPPIPGMAIDPDDGTIYVVWPDTTDIVGGQANVDVYFSKSSNQGDDWTTPTIVNGEGPNVGDQFFPWLEIDPTGRLHVVYLDSRHTAQNDGVVNGMFDAYYAYSEDGGTSWTEIRLTPQSWNSDDDGLDRPSQFIGDYLGLAVTDSSAWPFYPDTTGGDPNIYTHEIAFCEPPDEVSGLLVSKSLDETDLIFNWTDMPIADDYVLFQDFSPDGNFDLIVGTATSGTTGITTAVPFGNRYYLVAGQNDCALGPK